jgi:ribosomal protein S18 acetylase RimI-like enzyme
VIRRADRRDVDAIVAVFESSFATLDFLPTLHTHDEHLAFFGRCLADGEAWVWDEGGIRGFALLRDRELSHLYVSPDAFGQGVGSALLDRTKASLPDGFTLWVFQQNTRAREFYQRHGLRCVRLTDGLHNEERTPDALYEWRPTPEGSARAAPGSRGL